MKNSARRKKSSNNEALVMIGIAVIIVSGLYTFEYATGLPASVRGNPVYDTLSLPKLHNAAPVDDEAAFDQDFMDRLCARMVKRFSKDKSMWDRVSERVQKRFGFICPR
jgi:hypothetical protein